MRQLLSWGRGLDPVRVDAVAAAALLASMLIDTWTPAHPQHPVAQTIGALALSGAVAVRRYRLVPALVVVTLAFVAVHIVDGWRSGVGPSGFAGSLVALLLFYGGGAFLEGRRALLALALGIALTSMVAVGSGNQLVANLVWDDAVLATLPWFIGRMTRVRAARASASRERAERLDAEHEHYERAAALAERARLAREIHDVIAHSVSVMVIQAAGARTVMAGEPERAEAALRSVERAGRESLAEMRRLLGVLGDGRELRALAPQPGLEDLDDLVTRTRAAGLEASIEVRGEPVTVSPGLSLCAYRIVQEALTNAIKHAGPARAAISIGWCVDALELEVADDGSGDARLEIVSGGHGIAGMRERAALHGGSVEAGPVPVAGFAVKARLPLLERHA